jgi:quinol monooxygenase YgiN
MSVLIRFTPASLTAEKYDDAFRRLEAASNDFPPDGLDYHVCFGSDGDLRISEVWDSREHWDAFGRRFRPVLAATGMLEFSAPPELLAVHSILRR